MATVSLQQYRQQGHSTSWQSAWRNEKVSLMYRHNDSGTAPTKSFPESKARSSWVRLPNCGGSSPTKRLLAKSRLAVFNFLLERQIGRERADRESELRHSSTPTHTYNTGKTQKGKTYSLKDCSKPSSLGMVPLMLLVERMRRSGGDANHVEKEQKEMSATRFVLTFFLFTHSTLTHPTMSWNQSSLGWYLSDCSCSNT